MLTILAAACSPAAPDDREARPPTTASGLDPADVISGGPPPDGIPPIDDPKFVTVREADFLAPQEPVIVLELEGQTKAYPLRILIWHEIVNDELAGVPVTVTYCPLCNTGIAFRRPVVEGELLDFGTSGKLLHSNLVMYDRQTGSWWAQATGEAFRGHLAGTQLQFLPVQMVSWADARARYRDGLVLSIKTGFERAYGENPYVDYDQERGRPFLYRGELDPRLPSRARVLGVSGHGETLAIPYERLAGRARDGWAVATVSVGGRAIVAFWKDGTASAVDTPAIPDGSIVGAAGAFDAEVAGKALTFRSTPNGPMDVQTRSVWNLFGDAVAGPLRGSRLKRIHAMESFWFMWAAFHPDTAIWRP